MPQNNLVGAPIAPPPQSISVVALLIWVYQEQKADLISGIAFNGDKSEPQKMPHHRSLDSCVSVYNAARDGALIASTHHRQKSRLHEDADIIHQLLALYSQDNPYSARLLRHYGRRSSLPEWCDEVPKPYPLRRLTRNNRMVIVEDATLTSESHIECVDGQLVERHYPFCPLVYEPSLDYLKECRLEYEYWWRGLDYVKNQAPELKRFKIQSVGAPQTPWELS